MEEDIVFAQRIDAKYPEGLTGIFNIGSTRTAYALEVNRNSDDPGKIDDFNAYSNYSMDRLRTLIETFYNLGGKNLIMFLLTFPTFKRDRKYIDLVAIELNRFIADDMQAYYRANKIDPYFVNLEEWLTADVYPSLQKVVKGLIEFQKSWPYQEQHRKFILESGVTPLYLTWKSHKNLAPEKGTMLDKQLGSLNDLNKTNEFLYQHFIKMTYGIDIPMPHFYLASSSRGTLKIHLPIPSSLTAAAYLRLFYIPYPMFFMTKQTMKTIFEELISSKAIVSKKVDYSNVFSPEKIQIEYERIMKLASDPTTTLGLSRQFGTEE